MTTSTPADAIRAAIDALRHATDEEIAATAIRTAAAELLPRPHIYDRSPHADRQRLEILQFLALADELTGSPAPAASQEALTEAREELQAAAPLAAETIEPGPYSEDALRQMWNARSAENWDDLQPPEQLAFAQTQAIEADRRRDEPTPSVSDLPSALVYDGREGVRIEAASHKRTSWVVRDSDWCLNSNGEWERDYFRAHDDPDFLTRTRWPSAAAAWEALQRSRVAEGVEAQPAAPPS